MLNKQMLQLNCHECEHVIDFSIFDLDKNSEILCHSCGKKYILNDENLKRHLKKFEALCRQIIDSEEILSYTAVGIDVGDTHVKIPYKLLLTRLTSSLDLTVGGKPLSFAFRIEPLKDGRA